MYAKMKGPFRIIPKMSSHVPQRNRFPDTRRQLIRIRVAIEEDTEIRKNSHFRVPAFKLFKHIRAQIKSQLVHAQIASVPSAAKFNLGFVSKQSLFEPLEALEVIHRNLLWGLCIGSLRR